MARSLPFLHASVVYAARAQAPSANREVTLALGQLSRYASWSLGSGADADGCAVTVTDESDGEESAIVVADDGGELTGEGVVVDGTNGTEIARSSELVTIQFAQANWESVTLRFDPGTGEQVHMVVKTGTPSVAGPLSRVSNTRVSIALPATLTLDVSVVYNGKSSGTGYFLVGGS